MILLYMLREVDEVEIQGPPIDEIQKRSSCLKQGCVSALLVIFGTLLLLIIGMYFFVKPNTKHLDELPKSFPDSVPLYDEGNVDRITYTPGDERGEAVELLAFVPKAILSPLILALENADIATGADTENLWESFIRILGTPVSDHRNIIAVEWSELQANPRFLYSYYKTNLIEDGFIEKTDEKKEQRMRFFHENGTTVILQMNDDGNPKNGTDYAILKVYY
jgi:hypothetical protein